ncbi:hypothetical protein J3U76_04035, partial [Oceanisphaera sp. DM8]|nr:hypothetical protein [Oceanisphaera pacifica]
MDSQDQEERLVAARRGKWSRSGVPHRGWHCVDIEDLGSPQVECGMCESQSIRYVHHMEHPAYPEVLEVGCVCAGHMEEDVAAARTREASMITPSVTLVVRLAIQPNFISIGPVWELLCHCILKSVKQRLSVSY